MTIRHLRIFVEVCKDCSVTKAAERLYLAQPAVSYSIKELETYYGIKLFDKISQRLFLTERGNEFLQYARYIVELFDGLEGSIKDWDNIGVLRVGASITVGNFFMPQIVKEFEALFPHIQIKLKIANSHEVEKALTENKIDIGLIEGSAHNSYLNTETFFEDKLQFICPLADCLAGKKISLEELSGRKFLFRESGSAGRELFESVLASKYVKINVIWESSSTQAIIRGVSAGIGYSVLPYLLVKDAVDQRLISTFEVKDFFQLRNLSLIYHKNKYLTKSAQSFIALVKNKKAAKII